VLHGEHDFVPVELAERIAEAVPGACLSVLPGCGHFTYLEAPEAVFGEISRFCC
jgi:pimeloyl-ACP methyl ester carboxylesterase